uniref:HSF-type DNA-binding domain-containing protein n=2 Tax=Pseudictyota dubia TaxID=2749911 RepID=A0A7R9WLK0_9STRA|mmetsp:Transcript_8892/g.16418  ORF Transcript_8892/g.16418 Transcript_8892/m.16418 type:complete len:491 (+) Transcript_8892:245-1717(+)
MPKYFKQTKFASFQRQLNLYGFSRLTAGLDRGGYYHELFLRGKSFLAHRIYRMRVKGTRVRMASSPDSEPDFYGMPPLCAGVGPCSVRGCCGVRHQGPHHPLPQHLSMSPGAPAPPPTMPAPVSSSTGSMFRPPGAQPYQVATPPQSCQPCQPPPPPLQQQQQQSLQQQQQPLQQQQPFQPSPSPMTSAQYGSPLPPPSMQQQPQMQQPPPMQQPLQPQPQQLQSAPPTAVAASPSPATAPQVPQEPIAAAMVTPVNARPSLSTAQAAPYVAPAAPQQTVEVAKRRDEAPPPQPQPQRQPQLLPRPVFCPAPTPAAAPATPAPAPVSHHHHHRPPQQMGAIVEDDGDSDIDEVLFEGKVFHYLKPFPHHSPSSSPSRRTQQRPVLQLAMAAGVNDDDHDVPALPESVASYDAADEEEERRRRLWMTMQQQQERQQQEPQRQEQPQQHHHRHAASGTPRRKEQRRWTYGDPRAPWRRDCGCRTCRQLPSPC